MSRAELTVERNGRWWRALGCDALNESETKRTTRIEIDLRRDGKWVSQSTVTIPLGGPWNYLHSASVTHNLDPDFVVSAGGGADWLPLGVVAHLNGRWQLVPFDAPPILGTHLIIDSQAPSGWGLIHSTVDACGCASGPMTSIWYRFNGRLFVPATPPGATPPCASSALDRAHVLQGDPSNLGSPRWRFAPFHVTRVACLDGWALAANKAGRFALYNQQFARWHRAATGSFSVVRSSALDFALPLDLLARLKHRLSE